ncbi:MAG: OsmC family protein [Candidatus Zixiibacteriota bacterium]
MATKVIWKGDMSFEGETESNHRILMDLAEKSGGHDQGPRPMELVLVSLAGCTAVDVVIILKKMREQLDDLEVIVNSEKVDKHPRVYKKIEIEFKLKGKNLNEENVKKAIDLSFDKYCSVKTMLDKTAEISYSYSIVDV